MNETNGKYDRFLFWFPMLFGFFLPYIVYILGGGLDPIIALITQPDELVISLVGALIGCTPFIVVAFQTKKDLNRKMAINVVVKNWLIRFVPTFLLYVIFLVSVMVAAIKRLPGASTAPIALLLLPILAIGLILLGNVVIRRR